MGPCAAIVRGAVVALVLVLVGSAPQLGGTAAAEEVPDGVPDEDAIVTAPRGVDPTYRPVYDVYVPVGALDQALLDRYPEGTRFALAPGTHRLTAPLRPRSRQQLLGFPGAELDGSKPLRTWYRSGAYWYTTDQTQRLPRPGGFAFELCIAERPFCNHAEDVFLDGEPLEQVGSLSELRPGAFWFDYARDRIYLADNPLGRKVETTVATGALRGGGTGVVVRNLVIEQFGNPVQSAAIEGEGWIVERNEIRHNHGGGVTLWGGRLVGNRVVANGQAGVGGGGVGQLVEGNEVAYNNTEGYHPFEIAHATKWFRSTGLVVRGNWVHHNHASGLVTDVNNVDVLVEGNLVEHNEFTGLVQELGYDAVLRRNTVRHNGGGAAAYWFTQQLGIAVVNSRNVQVVDNLVVGNRGGGVLAVQDTRIVSPDNHPQHGTWQLENLQVRSNTIELVGDGSFGSSHTGFDIHPGVPDRDSYYTARGNVFAANTYLLPPGKAAGRYFFWTDGGGGHAPVTFAQWQALGFDTDGEASSDPATRGPLTETWTAPDGAAWDDSRWRVAPAGGVVDVVAGEGRMQPPAGVPWATAHAVARSAETTDGELLVRVRRVGSSGSGASFVWLRADDRLGDPQHGIVVQHAWNGPQARTYLFARVDGQSHLLGELPGTVTAGQAYWLRVRVEGDTVAARQWRDGQPEPSGWTSGTVTGLPPGVPRLAVGNGADAPGLDVRFDDLSHHSGG